MRPSIKLCAIAFTVLALSAGSAFAAGGFKIGTLPGTSESDCLNMGGTITTDATGAKVCKLPNTTSTQREPTNDPQSN